MPDKQTNGGLRQRPSRMTRTMARGRYVILAVLLAISLILAWRASRIGFDFSVDAVYAFDDPELRFFHERVVPTFGDSDNALVFLVSSEHLLAPQGRDALRDIHHAIAQLDGVIGVHSLLNVRVPRDVDGMMVLQTVFTESADDSENEAELAARMAAATTLQGWLISEDLHTAALVADLNKTARQQRFRAPVVNSARQLVERLAIKHRDQVDLRLTGIPVISEDITDQLRGDQVRFVPVVVLVMALLLWLSFRSWRGVLLPFAATGTATVWTLGVMTLEGHNINVANNAIIVLLLVIGVSDAVHLLARFQDELRMQRNAGITPGKLKTVAVVTEHLGLACLLTSLTTAIGFASLATARLDIIREFGIDAAIGVLLAYVVTLGLIPSMLAVLPLPSLDRAPSRLRHHSDRLLTIVARWAIKRRFYIAAAAIVLVLISVYGASLIRPHDRVLAELPFDHPAVATLEFATERLGGLVPFDIIIETEPGRADDDDMIQAMAKLQRFVQQSSLQARTLSIVDLLAAVERAVGNDSNQAQTAAHWSSAHIAQYLLLTEMDQDGSAAIAPYLSPKRDMLRMAGFADDAGTGRVLELRDALYIFAQSVLPADARLHVTGSLVVTSSALASVVHDLVSSLALALLIILVVMAALFRSIKVGLLALIPNAIPVLLTLGVMGFAGISLRPGTAVIFSMALGIAVDNSIHFLARFREEQRRSTQINIAIERAVRGSGRPILYTTVLLTGGLCVLLLSDFVALRHLAILGSTTFVAAMIVDLLLLPGLLSMRHVR